VKIDIGSEVIC